MVHALHGRVDIVERMLQDPRVRATVNELDSSGRTAFGLACCSKSVREDRRERVMRHLLRAHPNLTALRLNGLTPLAYFGRHYPTHHTTIAFLKQEMAKKGKEEKEDEEEVVERFEGDLDEEEEEKEEEKEDLRRLDSSYGQQDDFKSDWKLRLLVEARPQEVNKPRHHDPNTWRRHGLPHVITPLVAAASSLENVALVVWLLDELGADVNASSWDGTALHWARSPEVVTALLDRGTDVNAVSATGETPLHQAEDAKILVALLNRGADPTFRNRDGLTPLTNYLRYYGPIPAVATLLQDPRVRASVSERNESGYTPLHEVCGARLPEALEVQSLISLLQAGAEPSITNNQGLTPVDILRRENHNSSIAIIEGFPEAQKDAERAALLKARRLVVAANQNALVPSYLQGRVVQGRPLPRVELAPLVGGQNGEVEEEGRTFRKTLAFLTGVEGGGMPRDVFRVMIDLISPSWDPLRRAGAGGGGRH